jgi:hypothetical protein
MVCGTGLSYLPLACLSKSARACGGQVHVRQVQETYPDRRHHIGRDSFGSVDLDFLRSADAHGGATTDVIIPIPACAPSPAREYGAIGLAETHESAMNDGESERFAFTLWRAIASRDQAWGESMLMRPRPLRQALVRYKGWPSCRRAGTPTMVARASSSLPNRCDRIGHIYTRSRSALAVVSANLTSTGIDIKTPIPIYCRHIYSGVRETASTNRQSGFADWTPGCVRATLPRHPGVGLFAHNGLSDRPFRTDQRSA